MAIYLRTIIPLYLNTYIPSHDYLFAYVSSPFEETVQVVLGGHQDPLSVLENKSVAALRLRHTDACRHSDRKIIGLEANSTRTSSSSIHININITSLYEM